MALKQYLDVDLYEKQVIEVDIIDKELVSVDINVVDIIEDRGWVGDTVRSIFIQNETPTKVNAKQFTTEFEFIAGTLSVYYNGIKEKAVTETGSQSFEFPYDTLTGDSVEVSYIRIN